MISVLCDWCSDTKWFCKLVVSCVHTLQLLLSSYVSLRVPSNAVCSVLHTRSHTVYDYGHKGDKEAHDAQRHERHEMFPVGLEVLTGGDQAVQRPHGGAETLSVEGRGLGEDAISFTSSTAF